MKGFRYRSSVNVPYDRQGAIWFTAKRYEQLPEKKRTGLDNLFRAVAGRNWGALKEYLTTDATPKDVMSKHYIASFTTLQNLVKRFMEAYPDDLL